MDSKETEGNTTDSTSVSTPLTGTCSDIFKDLLDPALFDYEDQAPQLPSSEAPQGAKTPQSNEQLAMSHTLSCTTTQCRRVPIV